MDNTQIIIVATAVAATMLVVQISSSSTHQIVQRLKENLLH